MGIKFRLPFPEVVYENGKLTATAPYEGAVIRYTSDATEPTAASEVYKGAIATQEPENYRFATFYKDCNQSIAVGASNVELYNYLTPEVEI